MNWCRKHKKDCTALNYIEHSYILPSTFASLLGIPLGITSSGIGLKICAIASGIKKYKSKIKKKKQNIIK